MKDEDMQHQWPIRGHFIGRYNPTKILDFMLFLVSMFSALIIWYWIINSWALLYKTIAISKHLLLPVVFCVWSRPHKHAYSVLDKYSKLYSEIYMYMSKGAMHLQKSEEKYMGEFWGKRGKGKWQNYIIISKVKEERLWISGIMICSTEVYNLLYSDHGKGAAFLLHSFEYSIPWGIASSYNKRAHKKQVYLVLKMNEKHLMYLRS